MIRPIREHGLHPHLPKHMHLPHLRQHDHIIEAETRLPLDATLYNSFNALGGFLSSKFFVQPSSRNPYTDRYFLSEHPAIKASGAMMSPDAAVKSSRRVRNWLEKEDRIPIIDPVQVIDSTAALRSHHGVHYYTTEKAIDANYRGRNLEEVLNVLARNGRHPALTVTKNGDLISDIEGLLTQQVHGVHIKVIFEDVTMTRLGGSMRSDAQFVRLSVTGAEVTHITEAYLELASLMGAKPEDLIGKPLLAISLAALRGPEQ